MFGGRPYQMHIRDTLHSHTVSQYSYTVAHYLHADVVFFPYRKGKGSMCDTARSISVERTLRRYKKERVEYRETPEKHWLEEMECTMST